MANHALAYNGMPGTLDYMQESKLCDAIEVLKRNYSKELAPIPIFREVNKDIAAENLAKLKEMNFPTQDYSINDFVKTPRQAVEYERAVNRFSCACTLSQRIEQARNNATTTEELQRLDNLNQKLKEIELGE